jgi:putative ABC transport system substrate-binding protein
MPVNPAWPEKRRQPFLTTYPWQAEVFLAKSALIFKPVFMCKIITKYDVTGVLFNSRQLQPLFSLRSLFCALVVFSLSYSAFASASSPSVAVVYPNVREPYRDVFMEIIRGIETGLGQSVKHYVLDGDDDSSALLERVHDDHVDVVISLGRAGLSATKELAGVFPVVVGAVLISPGQETKGQTGISLTPDPEVFFARLKSIVPNAKEVTVIFDPRQKAWEIERARKVAGAYGLSLNAFPAEDLRLSAELYRKVLAQIKDGSIAIWLPQDNAVMDEQALLPVVLQEAWERNFVVFSGNLDHVRKGALFSLYPDNFGMGRSLAALALDKVKNGVTSTASINPLRDLLLAVNLRTAEHLGLRFASRERQQFDLVFPTP